MERRDVNAVHEGQPPKYTISALAEFDLRLKICQAMIQFVADEAAIDVLETRQKEDSLHSYRRSCSDAEAKRGQTLRSAVHQRSLNFLITKQINSWSLITKHLENAFQLPERGIIIISCVDNATMRESDLLSRGRCIHFTMFIVQAISISSNDSSNPTLSPFRMKH